MTDDVPVSWCRRTLYWPMSTLQTWWCGPVLGVLDILACSTVSLFGRRFFNDGIGDVLMLDQSELAVKRICLGESAIPTMKNLVLTTNVAATGSLPSSVLVQDATFDAPFPEFFPETPECHQGHFQLLRWSHGAPVRGIIVHFQMTADETFEFRRDHLAMHLLTSGFASILMMAPLYGPRRPVGQDRHYYRTVSDFIQGGILNMLEGAMVVNWCRSEFPGASLCTTGISAGAVPASGAALICGDVAVVPCIGPSSGRPFITGWLSSQVNWASIARSIGVESTDEARLVIGELFARKHLRKMIGWRLAAGRAASLVCLSVAASHDACVHPVDSQELHDILSGASIHEEINWLDGGHIAAISYTTKHFVPAIERAMQILERRMSLPMTSLDPDENRAEPNQQAPLLGEI